MGRKDASTARTPVDQYRKQIGKQDYKKTRPMLRATRLKAEAKKTTLGVKGYDTASRLPGDSCKCQPLWDLEVRCWQLLGRKNEETQWHHPGKKYQIPQVPNHVAMHILVLHTLS
ncbi:triple QxxK/R motif-containing protein isoform X1 [Tyto alba]|uniref:triple QxxK/R motif-containing protein isoform X1 n=1 Tax=Tyto alba TaxID=56313 RepID=UPI0014022D43|nr:triple QxxK/R motif-containing protein isoform X1 [Tyto alba]XP_042641805.1 triple QxxK/R motif-containing protein isoform X1 [Tyto alba]